MGDKDTKDTYDADDSIMDPPKTLMKRMTAFSIQVAKVSTPKSQRLWTMGQKTQMKPTTVSSTQVVKVSILQ